MEVPERELSDEFNQCWFNDALDELDPKKFSVLHERDAQATIDFHALTRFCIIDGKDNDK